MRTARALGRTPAAVFTNGSAEHPCVFSVDVEDGVSLAMRDYFGIDRPQTDRVERVTRLLLDMLDAHGARATFFVLGQVAERFPDLVQDIARRGHEVGVHGHDHRNLRRLSPAMARQEITRAKAAVEHVLGTPVQGHRAPAMSIARDNAWALDVVAECGFTYDSSILPSTWPRHGWQDFPDQPTRVITPAGHELIEVPISSLALAGQRVPFSGGSYFRLLPVSVIRRLLAAKLKEGSGMIYVHPYELDCELYPDYFWKALLRAPLRMQVRLMSYQLRRRSMVPKIAALLSRHRMVAIHDLITEQVPGRIVDLRPVSPQE